MHILNRTRVNLLFFSVKVADKALQDEFIKLGIKRIPAYGIIENGKLTIIPFDEKSSDVYANSRLRVLKVMKESKKK